MTLDHTKRVETIEISERSLCFSLIPIQARTRITCNDEAIGSVIRLDTDQPALCVSAPLEAEWAGVHCELLIAEANRIWNASVKDCSG
jgi:hypothetical protein